MFNTLKFLIALIVAVVVMLIFRALVFTIYTVPGTTLEPVFKAGDRVMVNRWSYGLRTGDDSLFPYGRLCRQKVTKGDWIAVEDSTGHVLLGQCQALPGDTIRLDSRTIIVPGKLTCAHHDYYHIGNFGLVREEQIIGRVAFVVFNHKLNEPLWRGYDASRLLFPL